MAQRQFRSDDTSRWHEGFGRGIHGSTYAVPANEGCAGTISTKALTLNAAGSFSNGDLVLIHQTRGTGAGKWELNKIVAGAGTTSLTMKYDLTNTYVDSGSSQAQIIELKQYNNLSLGAITAPSWDGNKGGIIAFLDRAKTTITGVVNLSGNDASGNTPGTGRGFGGGASTNQSNLGNYAQKGEGTAGPKANATTTAANGNGGGGAIDGTGFAGGGGGGNGTTGSPGGYTSTSSIRGLGGSTAGNAELTEIAMGGGGGGGSVDGPGGVVAAGAGAGIMFAFSKEFEITTGSINLDGGDGANTAEFSCGGGGGGGSFLLKTLSAILGTNKITANGGLGGIAQNPNTGDPNDGGNGGNGGVGRLHVDYVRSLSGSTTPTLNSRQDSSLLSARAGLALLAAMAS